MSCNLGSCLQYAHHINIVVTSGSGAPSVCHQLTNGDNEMMRLLSGFQSEMQSVKELTLCVVDAHNKPQPDDVARGSECSGVVKPQLQLEQQPESTEFNTAVPQSHGAVAGNVASLLAAAVPNLQKLNLRGCCWDAALSFYGASCPDLVSLDVQVPNVPIEALHDFCVLLKSLQNVSVGNTMISGVDMTKQVNQYMEIFLRTTRRCANLKSLIIDFHRGVRLQLSPDAWVFVPSSLQHLACDSSMEGCESFKLLARRVRSLCYQSAAWDLPAQLLLYPILEHLHVLSMGFVSIKCKGSATPNNDIVSFSNGSLHALKEKFLSGRFSLKCSWVWFTGTSEEIQDVFTWLPQILEVDSLTLKLQGESAPLCLTQIQRLFPAVNLINLSKADLESAEHWGVDTLMPLTKLHSIRSLNLRNAHFSLDISDLVCLCSSAATLKDLTVNAKLIKGVVESELKAEMSKIGREISFKVEI